MYESIGMSQILFDNSQAAKHGSDETYPYLVFIIFQ